MSSTTDENINTVDGPWQPADGPARFDWEHDAAYRHGDVVRVPRVVARTTRWRRIWCRLRGRPEPRWGHIEYDLYSVRQVHPPPPTQL